MYYTIFLYFVRHALYRVWLQQLGTHGIGLLVIQYSQNNLAQRCFKLYKFFNINISYLIFLFPVQSQDSVLSQKTEEARQMKQDLQRVQSLFTSAERELRYEKEKSMDLKRHNTLLEQEKLKVSFWLPQVWNF